METRPPAPIYRGKPPEPRRPKTDEERARADEERELQLAAEDPAAWGLPDGVMTSPDEVRAALATCRRKGLIVPLAEHLQGVQAEPFRGYRLTLALLGEEGFWAHYPLDEDGHRLDPVYRMRSRAAMRLATLLPVTIQPPEHQGGPVRHVWSCTVQAEVELPNGRRAQDSASATVDLTDDSAEARRVGLDGLERARISGARWAETRARGEVLRNLLGLAQDYDELTPTRPVVLFVPTRVLPADNEVVTRALLLNALGSAAAFYGPAEVQVRGPRPGVEHIDLHALPAPAAPPPPPPPPPPPTFEECIDALLNNP